MRLSWSVPADGADRFDFRILSAPDLRQPFTDTGLIPTRRDGRIEAIVPTAGVPARFYTVILLGR